MKISKEIAFLFLSAFYLLTTSAVTVSTVIDSIPTSGAKRIVEKRGQSKEIPPRFVIQRRHIPLAKEIPSPSVHIGATEFPPVRNEQCITVRSPLVYFLKSFHYSSFCDRAPPVA